MCELTSTNLMLIGATAFNYLSHKAIEGKIDRQDRDLIAIFICHKCTKAQRHHKKFV